MQWVSVRNQPLVIYRCRRRRFSLFSRRLLLLTGWYLMRSEWASERFDDDSDGRAHRQRRRRRRRPTGRRHCRRRRTLSVLCMNAFVISIKGMDTPPPSFLLAYALRRALRMPAELQTVSSFHTNNRPTTAIATIPTNCCFSFLFLLFLFSISIFTADRCFPYLWRSLRMRTSFPFIFILE